MRAGAGDIRKLNFYSGRTGEKINIIYCIDGEYIPESLAEINHFFRDWRNNKVHTIDARTVDILAAAHNLLRVDEPYMLLSGYRSPETNAMLRARSSGVARNSLHLKGQAADVRLQSRSVSEIAPRCRGVQGWRRRSLFRVQLRAYGLRRGAHLGPLRRVQLRIRD